MSDMTTFARPYAKAIFQHAQVSKQLPIWSVMLHNLSLAVTEQNAKCFLDNPAVTPMQQSQLLCAVLNETNKSSEKKPVENFINLLVQNKRLSLLPDIFVQFEALRAAQEKRLTVHVSSFSKLSNAQQQNLIKSLSQRFQREITLNISIDSSLLGGAVIRAGDLVIDGSVRSKLNKLGTILAA